jgi:hypothetical protein
MAVRKKQGGRSIQFLLDAIMPLELWCLKRFLTRLKVYLLLRRGKCKGGWE